VDEKLHMFNLLFLTSNRTKFQHACYLCRDYELRLVQKSQYGVVYKEPQTQDRDKLFKESMEDAKKRLSRQIKNKVTASSQDFPLNKLFFLEDTSVKIHALSTDSNESPGTEIKFWMKKHNFASVDKLLKERGNNRRVSVRSDILLYLPKNLREGQNDKQYKKFTSMKDGTIVEKEYSFKTQELYPWLDNRSFNKWFIPLGCRVPISILSEKVARKYDFRTGAFKDMLEFLERKHIISKKNVRRNEPTQEVLPLFNIPSFLVCGLPCVGKTTLGDFLNKEHAYYHIEASDFMYLSYHERHGINPTVLISDFAEKALRKTSEIVASQVLAHLQAIKDSPFIITGFRSPKELEIFVARYKGFNTVYQVYIEADSEKRYQRNLKSECGETISFKRDFNERDKQQLSMGLKEIKTKLKSKTIFNNSDFKDYFQNFLEKYPQVSQCKEKISTIAPKDRPTELEDAILITLIDETQYLTTTQIARRLNSCFPYSKVKTNKNNVSRYFNHRFHPYYEIKKENKKIKYHISPTGRSKAMFLLKHISKVRGGRILISNLEKRGQSPLKK